MLRFELAETSPRMVNVKDVKLSSAALKTLKEGANKFRNAYGDYFVAGYQWGVRYEVIISIAGADNPQEAGLLRGARCIKNLLDAVVAGGDYQYWLNYLKQLDISSYYELTTETVIVNGNPPANNVKDGLLSLESIIKDFVLFRNNAQKNPRENYAPLSVSLMRFRELPDAKNIIPEKLPVTQKQFSNIRDMVWEMFRAQCYYNTVMTFPASNLQNGNTLKDSWRTKLTENLSFVKNQLTTIASSGYLVSVYLAEFRNMADDFKALTERYTFYRLLLEEQNRWAGRLGWWAFIIGGGKEFRGYGFSSYDSSKIVAGDYTNGGYFHSDQRFYGSWHPFCHYIWNVNESLQKDLRYVYIELERKDSASE